MPTQSRKSSTRRSWPQSCSSNSQTIACFLPFGSGCACFRHAWEMDTTMSSRVGVLKHHSGKSCERGHGHGRPRKSSASISLIAPSSSGWPARGCFLSPSPCPVAASAPQPSLLTAPTAGPKREGRLGDTTGRPASMSPAAARPADQRGASCGISRCPPWPTRLCQQAVPRSCASDSSAGRPPRALQQGRSKRAVSPGWGVSAAKQSVVRVARTWCPAEAA